MPMNQTGVPNVGQAYNPAAEYAGMQQAQTPDQTSDQTPAQTTPVYTPPEQYMQTQAAPGPTPEQMKAYVMSKLAQNNGDSSKLQGWERGVYGELSPDQIRAAANAGKLSSASATISPVTAQGQAPVAPLQVRGGTQAPSPVTVAAPSYAGMPEGMKAFAPQNEGGTWSGPPGLTPEQIQADPSLRRAFGSVAPTTPIPTVVPSSGAQGPLGTSTPTVASQVLQQAANQPQNASGQSTQGVANSAADKQVADKLGEFTQFLNSGKANGSNLAQILGNVLDAIGVGFSGAAGVQRKTRLQQQYEMQVQSQLERNKALANYQSQAQMLQNQYMAAINQAQATGDINRINAVKQFYEQQQGELQRIYAQALVGVGNIQAAISPYQLGSQMAGGEAGK